MKRTWLWRSRGSVALVAGLGLALAAPGLVAACGSNDGAAPPTCSGAGCDAGAPDSSAADAPSNMDGEGTDAARDADAAPPVCGDAGAPGTLDETFGDGGLVWLKYPGSAAYSVTTQTDGRVLLGGYTMGGARTAVVRLRRDGAVDTSFGTGGVAENTPGDFSMAVNGLAVQPDGRIVAVGTAGFASRPPDFLVLRYLPDGSLDSSFGIAGVVLTDFGGRDDYAHSVVVQPDGRILVGGLSELNAVGSTSDYALARYNGDGSPDTTFGIAGKVAVDVHGTGDSPGLIALGPGGKILVAGHSRETASPSGRSDVSVARLNADGSLDALFATGGKAVTSLGPQTQTASGIAVDGVGRVVLAGMNGSDFGLFRMTPSGVLDTTLGMTGAVATDFDGRGDDARAIFLQTDAKVLVVGEGLGSRPAPDPDNALQLARYSPDGALDPTFGVAGKAIVRPAATTSYGTNGAAATGCHVIVVGGWSYDQTTTARSAMGVARFNR